MVTVSVAVSHISVTVTVYVPAAKELPSCVQFEGSFQLYVYVQCHQIPKDPWNCQIRVTFTFTVYLKAKVR